MKQRPRIYYSDSQKALMWERWKEGATFRHTHKPSSTQSPGD